MTLLRSSQWLLLVGCLFAVHAEPNNGYLPPTQDVCIPRTRTQVVQRTEVQRVVQPQTQVITRTQQQVQNAIATVAVTTTLQRVEQRVVSVPVIRTQQSVVYSTRVSFQTVPIQGQDVIRTSVTNAVQIQTRTNERLVTLTQTRVRTNVVNREQIITRTEVRPNIQVVTRTVNVRGGDVVRTQITTLNNIRTVLRTPAPFVTTFTSTVVNNVQRTQFIQAQPNTRYQTVNRENVRTQIQNIVRTNQVVRTQEQRTTVRVPAVRTVFRNINRDVVRTQNVIRTQVINSEVVRTNFVPEIVVSTQFVNRVNTQNVVQTIQSTAYVQRTVQGPGRVQQVQQTVNRDVVRTQYRDVQGQGRIITQTKLIPCQQGGGYNYNSPRNPLRLG